MLDIRNLRVRYRGRSKPALENLTLNVGKGEIVLLAGDSASGKSTAMQAVCGFIPDIIPAEISGTIALDGRVYGDPTDIAGVACMVQQDPETQFCTETVEEEVAFGPENLRFGREEIVKAVEDSLASVKASHLRDRRLSTLSGGEKQKVAIASMLSVRPKLLILDEPTANLDRRSVGQVIHAIESMRKRADLTLVIVEHRVKEFIDMVERVIVLSEGKVKEDCERGSDAFRRLREDAFSPVNRRRPSCDSEETVISVNGLGYEVDDCTILDDVGFTINRGAVVALMGDNGAGKTTVLRHLTGLQAVQRGELVVRGKMIDPSHQIDAWTLGRDIGMVFQNPNHQIFEDTVEGEMFFAPRNFDAPLDMAEEFTKGFEEREALIRYVHPHCLSFGQKRRVNIHSGSSHGPQILLLDEPFAGQDRGNAERIIEVLEGLQKRGTTIVVVTHDHEFARGFCTHAIIMDQGRVVASGPVDSIPERCWVAISREGRSDAD